MEAAHLVAFNAALLVAIMSPGPSILYLLRTSLAEGRATALATAFGLATMAAGWTGLALLGLDGLFRLFPWAYAALKIIGAGYLIHIAWTTWRHAAVPVSARPLRSGRRAYLSGFAVNLSNPKSVMFAAAVIVVIFPANLGTAEKLVIFSNHLAVEMILQPTLALVFSSALMSRRYLSAKPVFDRVAATILGTLGLHLLLTARE